MVTGVLWSITGSGYRATKVTVYLSEGEEGSSLLVKVGGYNKCILCCLPRTVYVIINLGNTLFYGFLISYFLI